MQTAHCCFNEIMDLFLILLACNNLISALSSLKRPNLINNASSGSKLYQTGLQMLEPQNSPAAWFEFVPRDEAAFQLQNLFTPAFIGVPLWIKLCFKLKTQTFAAQWFNVMLNKHYLDCLSTSDLDKHSNGSSTLASLYIRIDGGINNSGIHLTYEHRTAVCFYITLLFIFGNWTELTKVRVWGTFSLLFLLLSDFLFCISMMFRAPYV